MLWFYDKLKQYRKEHHLTQKQMAEQCHLSTSTIAKLENPKNKRKIPSYQTLHNLSNYMELKENDPLKMISEERYIIKWLFKTDGKDGTIRKTDSGK